MNWPSEIPYINPDVRYLGVTCLREMNQKFLEELNYPIVLKKSEGGELAVLLPWKIFLELQSQATAERQPLPKE